MVIPGIQSIMLPLLELAEDNNIHRFRHAVDLLADRLRLTDDERRDRTPDDRRKRFYIRVTFVRHRLRRVGLLEDPKRGQFRITELGRRVLESRPSRVDLKFLRQFEESQGPVVGSEPPPDAGTPEEALQDAHETLRNSLAVELLNQVEAGVSRVLRTPRGGCAGAHGVRRFKEGRRGGHRAGSGTRASTGASRQTASGWISI